MSERSANRARLRQAARALAIGVVVVALCGPGTAGSAMRGDRVSRISEADEASEYWDIVARFDSGYSLFTRFLVTHEGPGKHTGVATWYLVAPDGMMVPFRNGRRRERWTLSPDGSRMRMGSSILDQRGSVHSLEYDSKKRGISIALRFSPDGAVAYTDAPVPGGYAIDLLDLGTPVVGTIWLKGMAEPLDVSGTIAMSHTWMDESEADVALRRIEFAAEGDGPLLYVNELTTPSGLHHRWLVIERDGEVLYQSGDFSLDSTGDRRERREGYPVPNALRIRGDGIEGEIRSERIVLETNPLDDIPQPFRFLLSLKTRPHRAWAVASFEVTLKTNPNLAPLQLRGNGIASITYLNPLPRNLSSSEPERVEEDPSAGDPPARVGEPGA